MKVFGIGLNKTGTSTLGACFRHLGYNHMSVRRDLLEKYRAGNLDAVFSEIDRHESFEDWPYPLMYRELNERYQDAKFILTLRKSPEVWLQSLKRHSMWSPPIKHCRKLAYGFRYPHYAEAEHLAIYNRHNREVIDYFASVGASDRLLVICWENGDGWEKLCSFLGHDVPDIPIPRDNVSDMRPPSGNEKANRALMMALSGISWIPTFRRTIA